MAEPQRTRPLLVYDGECEFCVYSVRHWQRLTGDRVEYQPFQKVAASLPHISEEEFRSAIQLVLPHGQTYSGAAAAFRTLQSLPGRGIWMWLYRWLPGFAPITEACYRFVARHRPTFHRISRLLWGRERIPPEYDLINWVFLRMLAVIYLAAFASFGVQAPGLIGADGILPLSAFLDAVAEQLGSERYWQLPIVFWFNASDAAIQGVASIGVLASIALFVNVLPRFTLILLYGLYLSLFYAGQTFMTFQWDVLLLEAGFLAIFLPWHPRLVVWLYCWLMFRFMFLSGAVKLASGDPHWADLSALSYYYETQPLPTMLAWYAHNLPAWMHVLSARALFFIQLVVPFLIFTPRRLRFFAAWCFLALQLLILLTGNYNFFNLLSMALCLFLFDDQAIRRLVPAALRSKVLARPAHGPRALPGKVVLGTIAGVIVVVSLLEMWTEITRRPPVAPLAGVQRAVAPLRAVNGYGLFRVMTTVRNEIVIEGSADGQTWLAYEFKYKPGDLQRAPGWMIPHQPRLDWQMWFAALGTAERNPWFQNLIFRLLSDSPPVTTLLKHDPFPDAPPTFVRAQLYRYSFADPETKASTDQWWVRQPARMYLGQTRLRISVD